MRREKQFRGISIRLARNYLKNLGGSAVDGSGDDTTVEGDGWRAELAAEKVEIGPSMELTEVTVVFEADDLSEDAFEELIEDFSRKAMRAGG
ncbi:hypothetical protein B4589_002280 [Halolamina sp. CBA1230]|uniref:hypothetical protein n=1 Tax=Halolamina sp. CBA1230 TaxID=1853690 RepID=UPI0009A15279|nr:hypothetical protein B4589_002280 [Halolamina sp. CBA1230]